MYVVLISWSYRNETDTQLYADLFAVFLINWLFIPVCIGG